MLVTLLIAAPFWSLLPIALSGVADLRPVADPDAEITFTRDVAPILYQNCVTCHRPGEVGPMSLVTFEEVRPWARVIKERVVQREMPPWHPVPGYDGVFLNERRLTEEQIETIVAWVDGGAVRGDPAHMPAVPTFPEGWVIGEPDVVFTMGEEFAVPAVDPELGRNWIDFRVPTDFAHDMFVVAAEVRPGDRSVVHHAMVSIREADGEMLRFTDPEQRGADGSLGQEHRLQGYIPGHNPMQVRDGVAKRIPAGAILNFNLHYEPNGTATVDRTSIGLIFAREPVGKQLRTRMASVASRSIDIPPFTADVKGEASFVFPYDVYIDALRPHMHERGVDMRYTLVYPDGSARELLYTRFDYRWQTNYVFREPVFAPEGSRMVVVGTWDNSPENPLNPDPTVRVRYGQGAKDEMMVGYVEYTLADEDLREETAHLERPTGTARR